MAKKGGLPSKYAKMGFAKGWKAYKAAQRKRGKPQKTKTTPKGKGGSKNMGNNFSAGIISTAATLAGAVVAVDGIFGGKVVEKFSKGDIKGGLEGIAYQAGQGLPDMDVGKIGLGVGLGAGAQAARVMLNKARWNPKLISFGGVTIRLV